MPSHPLLVFVEHSAEDAFAIQFALKSANLVNRTVFFATMRQAMEYLIARRDSLVVLEAHLMSKTSSAPDFITMLRTNPHTRLLIAGVFSRLALPVDVERARSLSADFYFRKPLPGEAWESVLSTLIECCMSQPMQRRTFERNLLK